MEEVGLDRERYIFGGGGKPQAICEHLKEITHTNFNISTIVLIDNSDEFSIKLFLEKMPKLVEKLGFSNLKIIGIEFARFSDMATQEAIEEELTILESLRKRT